MRDQERDSPERESEGSEDWEIQEVPQPKRKRYTIPRKTTEVGTTVWDLSLAIWPLEERPDSMRNQAVVNTMTLQNVFSFKEHYKQLQKREGKGETSFGSDQKLPMKKFGAQNDNASDMLHEVRFERGPVAELSEYWEKMPKKRMPTYRHLALEHAGLASQVNECVLTRAHDRTMPLRLRMFSKGNQSKKGFTSKEAEGKEPADSWEYPKAILEMQMALCIFTEVYASLWPLDPTPRLLNRLFVEYEFGAAYADSEKERCR